MQHKQHIPTARETAWQLIRALRFFTLDDLQAGCGISQNNAQRLVRGLVSSGFVAEDGRTGGQGGGFKRYRLVGDPEKLPATPPEAVTKRPEDWRHQAWQTMRLMKDFTVPDVRRTLTVRISYNALYRYLRALVEAGYVEMLGRRGKNGATLSNNVYHLKRDEGPTPPAMEMSRRKGREVSHA